VSSLPNRRDAPGAARRLAALAGHEGDEEGARDLFGHADGVVRATALGALARMAAATAADVARARRDPAPDVRRRACVVGVTVPGAEIEPLLYDDDPSVVAVAAWALGERGEADAVGALAGIATGHEDPLCREAAVAALGALGDPAGLPAILAATSDKPAVRRRAVIALAPFEGPDVDAALERALTDRDRQVRQAAEDLLEPPTGRRP
jgi:HEAT repeat protein